MNTCYNTILFSNVTKGLTQAGGDFVLIRVIYTVYGLRAYIEKAYYEKAGSMYRW